MTRCAIYCRISRDRVGAGLGVERQETECRELAARLGFTVAQVYVDNDISAYSGKPRPAYRQLLADIEAGLVDAVLVWHTDRLHRNPAELENYILACDRRQVPTHTVTAGVLDLTTPDGRMVARITGAVARREVEHTIKRINSEKQQLATSGGWAGGRRPYGYESDGVTVRPAEKRVLADATDAVLLGTSLRSQASKLNAAGSVTSTGRPWTPTELKKVLIRPRNAGLREHRGQIIGKAVWEPVVAEEKWRAVRALLADPSRRTNSGRARRWLLSGIARCGVCGAPLRAVTLATTRGGAPSYTCTVSKCVVRKAAELDAHVSMVMRAGLRLPSSADLLRPKAPDVDLAALTAEQTNLQERLDELADNLDLDERTLARRGQKLRERLAEIAEQKAVAGRGNMLSGVVDAPDPGAAWDALDLDRKRALVDLLMVITVNRTRKGRRPGWRPGESYFDPDSVTVTKREWPGL